MTFYTAGDAAIGPAGLPLAAALAIGCGMTEDAALAAVTVNAARALGVEKKLGTIEADRIASLFTCRGSPFAPGARASRSGSRASPSNGSRTDVTPPVSDAPKHRTAAAFALVCACAAWGQAHAPPRAPGS